MAPRQHLLRPPRAPTRALRETPPPGRPRPPLYLGMMHAVIMAYEYRYRVSALPGLR